MSRNKNIFNSVRYKTPQRSTFDLSHTHSFTTKFGALYPALVMECMPSDFHRISSQNLCRMAPMQAPVMHPYDIFQHRWFVPYRILWENWDEFIMNRNATGIVHPYATVTKALYDAHPLIDAMGCPDPGVGGSYRINVLPFVAYFKIWFDRYRDQNLQGADQEWEFYMAKDGENQFLFENAFALMRQRCWEHDYFTSALPSSQAGNAAVVPLLGDAPVKRNNDDGITPFYWSNDGATGTTSVQSQATPSTNVPPNDLYADLSESTGVNVIELRRTIALQKWAEKAITSGRRFYEGLRAFFGIAPKDERMQIPEWVGGSRSPLVISEVLNTTGTEEAPQGNMSGHGVTYSRSGSGSKLCEEHGVIIDVVSIMPRTAYQQGLPRMFGQRDDWMDYPWPEFANIGEQELWLSEVAMNTQLSAPPYTTSPIADPKSTVFGYVPRYSEFKYLPNRVSGDFKTTLNHWTHQRIFGTQPNLNATFVECNPDKRIFAVIDPNVDDLYVTVDYNISSTRPLPYFGTPTIEANV